MSYYQFNRQEILQKAKNNYWKEKTGKYCLKNKEELKEKSKIGTKIYQKKKKINLKISKKEISAIDTV